MCNRTVAAITAISCIGLVFAAGEASAGSAGIAAARGAPASPRASALPLVRPGQVPAISPAVGGGSRAFSGRARHHHGFLRRQVPLFAGFALPYYESGIGTNVQLPLQQGVPDPRPVPPGEPVVVNGRVCFAQAYVVPSETGGRRPVTVSVTRC